MLNQYYNEKVVMHSSRLEAILSPCSGVKRTLLERSEDSEYAVSTTFVEFQADSFFDEHEIISTVKKTRPRLLYILFILKTIK